jgi:hypothetical protein
MASICFWFGVVVMPCPLLVAIHKNWKWYSRQAAWALARSGMAGDPAASTGRPRPDIAAKHRCAFVVVWWSWWFVLFSAQNAQP